MTRRDFLRLGTVVLGSLIALVLAVPGVAYLLDPLRRKGRGGRRSDTLTRLKRAEGRRAAVVRDHRGAAGRLGEVPREPVGSVWLVRQPDGSEAAGRRASRPSARTWAARST